MRIPLSTSIHPSSSTSSIQVPHVVNKNSSSLSSFRYPSSSFPSILDCRPSIVVSSSSFIYPFFLSVSSGFWVAIPYRARSEKPLLQKRLLFYLLFLSRRLPASMSCLPSIILRYLRSRHQALSSVASILVSNLVPSLSLPLSPLCIPSISTSVFSHIVDTLFQSPPSFVRSSSRSVSTFFQSLFPSLSPMYPRTPFPCLINSISAFNSPTLPPSLPCRQ